MAADNENDESTLNKVVSPKMLKTDRFNDGNRISTSFSDFICPICLQILIEPVVMPCEHELCGPCFKQNVEEANFLCPLCRMRISSWARRNSRNGTLVNSKRWEQIQKLFPEKCQKRLRGEDDEDLFDTPPPKRTISQDGELRKEYEEEMRKLQQAREQEMRASEEAVHQLQEEEQRLARSLEHQALQDEELAKRMVAEEKEKNSQEKERLSQPSTTGTPSSNKSAKGKKIKTQDTQVSCGHSTLDRWFIPTKQSSCSGLQKNRNNHKNITQSHLTTTDTEQRQDLNIPSSSTSSDICNLNISQLMDERTEQEEKDFQFALKLQKEFDLVNKKAAKVDRMKGAVDAYLLRTVSDSENVESCSDS